MTFATRVCMLHSNKTQRGVCYAGNVEFLYYGDHNSYMVPSFIIHFNVFKIISLTIRFGCIVYALLFQGCYKVGMEPGMYN